MEKKELRKEITQQLKELGLKRKDYSLRIRESGYADTYVNIEIKNPYINIADVDNALKKYNDIRRDIATCEVLQGCNTFVNVQYEYGLFEEVSKAYDQEAKEIIEASKNSETQEIYRIKNNSCYLINDDGMLIVRMDGVGRKIIYDYRGLAIILFKIKTLNIF